jgi:hypothetical protein
LGCTGLFPQIPAAPPPSSPGHARGANGPARPNWSRRTCSFGTAALRGSACSGVDNAHDYRCHCRGWFGAPTFCGTLGVAGDIVIGRDPFAVLSSRRVNSRGRLGSALPPVDWRITGNVVVTGRGGSGQPEVRAATIARRLSVWQTGMRPAQR